ASIRKRADTAILLRNLCSAAQGVILVLSDTVGQVTGGEVGIGHGGGPAQRIVGGVYQGVPARDMLGTDRSPYSIEVGESVVGQVGGDLVQPLYCGGIGIVETGLGMIARGVCR